MVYYPEIILIHIKYRTYPLSWVSLGEVLSCSMVSLNDIELDEADKSAIPEEGCNMTSIQFLKAVTYKIEIYVISTWQIDTKTTEVLDMSKCQHCISRAKPLYKCVNIDHTTKF